MTIRHRVITALCSAVPVLVQCAGVQAQTPVDTFRLGVLHQAAVRQDPRAAQLDLLVRQSSLRQRSIDADMLPAVSVLGQAQYQSDVATIPFEPPGGAAAGSPPRDTYDAHIAARQRVYDPAIGARRDVERAQLAESEARVRTALHALLQQVNDAFFNALLFQSQAGELAAAIASIEAQLVVATQRVAEGAALPGEAAALEAEALRRRQTLDELDASGAAARIVLGDLTGRSITTADALALPDLDALVLRSRAALAGLRARPEYDRFASTHEVLEQQRQSIVAQTRPRIGAYGRAGYGRPGLNPLARDFDSYWLTGVQVEWTPWTWGTTRREREVLAVQQQIVESEEAAFARSIERSGVTIIASIDRLERALATDDRIVALREDILRETRLRFDEGVITAAEFVDRESDVLEARLARATHRVQLAQAQARFLTLIGVEIS